jgi:hypothetical protein
MSGNYSFSAWVIALLAAIIILCLVQPSAEAYRICTFRGTVLDHGWRSMTIKSGTQCAEVNVGWRTKYLPNRRPCVGERVAVDFMLEDGYMKATKIVSLSPPEPEPQCYPPAPPGSSVCRTEGGEEAAPPDTCSQPRAICSTKPPAHVADREWSPEKKPSVVKPPKPEAKKPPTEKKDGEKKIAMGPKEEKGGEAKERPAPSEEKRYKALSGEVVASTPKSLSVRVTEEGGEAAEVVNIRVGLKTKFIPFRRPAVGEKVKIEYMQENGDKFGYTVQVTQ